MIAELEDYYRELILDHSRRPRNRGELEGATHHGQSVHAAKGDAFIVHLRVESERVETVNFEGAGSAVALASASLMTRYVAGKTLNDARQLSARVRALLTQSAAAEDDFSDLEDLNALAGVRQFPARIACALLAWEALENALKPSPETTPQ